jgi:hypothetical protein
MARDSDGRRNFERHLVGGTTDAAGLDLDTRLGVFNGAVEKLKRINAVSLLVQLLDGGIDDALSERLLAVCMTRLMRCDEFAIVAAVLVDSCYKRVFCGP